VLSSQAAQSALRGDRCVARIPFGSVPVGDDVGRHIVSLLRSVHGRVERVEWLEKVKRLRIAVKQLADERRPAFLVRQNHNRRHSYWTNTTILSP